MEHSKNIKLLQYFFSKKVTGMKSWKFTDPRIHCYSFIHAVIGRDLLRPWYQVRSSHEVNELNRFLIEDI